MRDEVKQRIEETVKANKVVVFIKGSKSFPQCGFSARVIDLLKKTGSANLFMVFGEPDVEIRHSSPVQGEEIIIKMSLKSPLSPL